VITRRRLVITLCAATFSPRAVFAQAKQTPVVIGLLTGRSREESGKLHASFREGLAALGLRERLQIVIEERWADGRIACRHWPRNLGREAPLSFLQTPHRQQELPQRPHPARPSLSSAAIR
jgi:hypothetical protein